MQRHGPDRGDAERVRDRHDGHLVLQRRRERERHAGLEAPNRRGTVKVLRSIEDVGRLAGELIVFPTIEPTLTPLFPLVSEMIAEMGGLQSHAAILARTRTSSTGCFPRDERSIASSTADAPEAA